MIRKMGVLCAAVLVGAGCQKASTADGGASPAVTEQAPSTSTAEPSGGPRRAGWYSAAPLRSVPRLDWTTVLPHVPRGQRESGVRTAVVSGSRVLVSSTPGRVALLDVVSGALQWERPDQPPSGDGYTGPSALAESVWWVSDTSLMRVPFDGTAPGTLELGAQRSPSLLALGEVTVVSGPTDLKAFDRAMKPVWTIPLAGVGGLAGDGSELFTLTEAGTLAAYELGGEPRKKWEAAVMSEPDALAGPVVTATSVLVAASGNRQDTVCAYERATGKGQWCTAVPCPRGPAPIGLFLVADARRAYVGRCLVTAVALDGGQVAWSQGTSGPVVGLAGAGNLLYVSHAVLEALDATMGTSVWKAQTPAPLQGPAVPAGDRLLVAGAYSAVHAFRAADSSPPPKVSSATPQVGRAAIVAALEAAQDSSLDDAAVKALDLAARAPHDRELAAIASAFLEGGGEPPLLRADSVDAGSTDPLPTPVEVSAGSSSFVRATALALRARPAPDAPVLRVLWPDARVTALEPSENGFVKVRAWVGPSFRPRLVVRPLDFSMAPGESPGEAPGETTDAPALVTEDGGTAAEANAAAGEDPGPFTDGPPGEQELDGYVYTGFLHPTPLGPALALAAEARTRAATDPPTARRLLQLAIARSNGVAPGPLAAAAVELEDPLLLRRIIKAARGSGPSLTVQLAAQVVSGCRGNLEKAGQVESLADRSLKDACLVDEPASPPCYPCEEQACVEDAREARELQRERRKEMSAYSQALRAARKDARARAAAFPIGPMLWITISNPGPVRAAPATLVIHSPRVEGGFCDLEGGPGVLRDARRAEIELPTIPGAESLTVLVSLESLQASYSRLWFDEDTDVNAGLGAAADFGTAYSVSLVGGPTIDVDTTRTCQ